MLVLLEIRQAVAVGVEGGIGGIERVEPVGDLPAVGEAVAVGVGVVGVGAGGLLVEVAEVVAVGIGVGFEEVGDVLGGDRGGVETDVGDVAVQGRGVCRAVGGADPERVGAVHSAGGVGGDRDQCPIGVEGAMLPVVGQAEVQPFVGGGRGRGDVIGGDAALADVATGGRAVEVEGEAIGPGVVVGGFGQDGGGVREGGGAHPGGGGEAAGENQIGHVRHAHIAAESQEGVVGDAVEAQGAADGGAGDARHMLERGDLGVVPLSAPVGDGRAGGFGEAPPAGEIGA